MSRRHRLGLFGFAALTVVGGLSFAPAAFAAGTTSHTQTFSVTGAQATFTVPSDAQDLVVTAAGGQGATPTGNPGGAGGIVTVNVGTTWNGQTLNLLVGGQGGGTQLPTTGSSGGSGSFVASTTTFLIVAGGGGAPGVYTVTGMTPPSGAVPAGAGGYSTSDVNGSAGAAVGSTAVGGAGGTISAPGQPAANPGGGGTFTQGTAGTSATIAAGVITPGLGGSARTGAGAAGGGGSGYTGGGGGSTILSAGRLVRGAGGGGAGFLATGLTAASTAPNTQGNGYITFTWNTIDPVVPAAPAGTSADPGLPPTGVNDGLWMGVIGGTAAVIGAGLVLFARSRSRRARHASLAGRLQS